MKAVFKTMTAGNGETAGMLKVIAPGKSLIKFQNMLNIDAVLLVDKQNQ